MAEPIYSWDILKTQFPMYISGGLLTVVRHGQTTFNAAKLISGSREDISLSPLGKETARRLADIEGTFDLAITSTLPRAIQTLDLAIDAGLAVDYVTHDARLNERCLGVLEGRPFQDIPEYRLGDFSYAPKGGESYLSLTQRLLSFLVDFDWAQRTLLVTHVGPMRILLGIFDGTANPAAVLDRRCDNAKSVDLVVETIHWPRFLPDDVT